eukprot:COSAG01_NODE_74254_length_221_cov_21.073770_1_plen_53_part_10
MTAADEIHSRYEINLHLTYFSRHAILDQRFDRSENSDLSFAELHACSQPAAMQ